MANFDLSLADTDLIGEGIGGEGGITLPTGNNFEYPIIGQGVSNTNSRQLVEDIVLIGKNAKASGAFTSVSIEQNSICTGSNNVVIGAGADAEGPRSVVIGQGAKLEIGGSSIIIGARATSHDVGIAIGESAASDLGGIAIGNNASATATNSLAFGYKANNTHTCSTLIAMGQSWGRERVQMGNLDVWFFGAASDLAENTGGKPRMAYHESDSPFTNYISFEDLFSKSGSSSSGATLPAGNSLSYPVIGSGASSEMTTNVVIGENAASTNGHYNVLIGQNSIIPRGYNTIIGYGITGATSSSVVIGTTAQSTAVETVVIGKDASTEYTGSIVAGADASVTGDKGIAIGYNAQAARGAIAIGPNTNVTTGQITIKGSGSSINIGDGSIKLQSDNLTLYFFKTGSTLAAKNTNGEAGIGFVCGTKKGCIELSSLLTKPFTLPS